MTMRHKLFLLALTLGFAICYPVSAQAAEGPATQTIRHANQRFQELLSAKAAPGSEAEKKLGEKLTQEMRDLFDIRDLVRRALIDHWDKMSQAQREEVVTTLRRIIERNYIKQLRANLKYQVTYDGENPSDRGDTTVATTIKAERKGRPVSISVDYVLHKDRGKYRVFDVVTDEVSMLRNYRSQFNRIISKEGVQGLIAKMRKRLASEESGATE